MNDKMNELYIKFHTERRLFIEKETERRMDLRIAAGWNNSPAVRKECLYEAMGVRSEVDEFRMFAKLIIRTSILRMEHEDRDCGEWMGNVLMMHFNLTLAELDLPLQDEE